MNLIKPLKIYSILKNWWETINLTLYEKNLFNKDIVSFNQQLIRLKNRRLRIGVFGRAGVGKSAVLNSILNDDYFETNILNGYTKEVKTREIYLKKNKIRSMEMIDFPGFDICNLENKKNKFTEIFNLDLIIFIIAGDPNRNEIKELNSFINNGKKIILIFNKIDNYESIDIKNITKKIKRIFTKNNLPIILHSSKNSNKYKLKDYFYNLVYEIGENLLIINTFQLANKLIMKIKENRLLKRKKEAQTIIGKFATLKASGVALNPLIFADIAGSYALDAILIKELSKVYGLQVKASSAKKLLQTISINNFFLGATQLGINFSCNIIKKISLLSAPFTSGLSLVPYGPVAIVQAALAVQATKIVGKLAAQEILCRSKINGLDPNDWIQIISQKESEILTSNTILSLHKQTKHDLSIFLP